MEGRLLRDAYLLWIKQQRDNYANSTFGCDWNAGHTIADFVFGTEDVGYYEIMESLVRDRNCTDRQVQIFWDRDREYLRTIQTMSKGHQIITHPNKYFLTITCDKSKATPEKLLKFLYFLRDKCKWVKTMKAVIENHRHNGIILHTHIILEVDESIKYASTVKDKLYALKPCTELIAGSNFIDYLYYHERHDKYIIGDKQEDKLPLVELDVKWRIENNIPHLIEKKK